MVDCVVMFLRERIQGYDRKIVNNNQIINTPILKDICFYTPHWVMVWGFHVIGGLFGLRSRTCLTSGAMADHLTYVKINVWENTHLRTSNLDFSIPRVASINIFQQLRHKTGWNNYSIPFADHPCYELEP